MSVQIERYIHCDNVGCDRTWHIPSNTTPAAWRKMLATTSGWASTRGPRGKRQDWCSVHKVNALTEAVDNALAQ